MVIEVALGVVLGVVLLACLPLLVVGTVAALRWLVPLALAAVALGLVIRYPSQVAGTAGIAAVALLGLAGWLILPGKLQRSNSRIAKHLSSIHSRYFALLDNKPPFQGWKWLPLRIVALCIAIAVTGAIAAAALLALDLVWQGGA
jgi:hypothetical protein